MRSTAYINHDIECQQAGMPDGGWRYANMQHVYIYKHQLRLFTGGGGELSTPKRPTQPKPDRAPGYARARLATPQAPPLRGTRGSHSCGWPLARAPPAGHRPGAA